MRLLLLVTGSVALLVRLLFLVEVRQVPYMRHLIGDAAGYYAWAQELAGGCWWGTEPFYQAPLYPYVLGALFRLLTDDVWLVRIVQACWGAAAVCLLGYGTWKIFGRTVGLMAAGMLALYAPAIVFDGLIQKASLGCLLTCALMAGMGVCGARPRIAIYAAMGIAGGLLAITRENALIWLPLIGIWIGWRRIERGDAPDTVEPNRRSRFAPLAAYVLGVMVVLIPVGARNGLVGGSWSPSTFQSGPNFYIGNHRGADGRYQPLVRGHETPAFERADATLLAERAEGRTLTAQEVSAYWWSRATADIRADVTGWMKLLGSKWLMVWNRYEVSDAESFYVYAESSRVVAALAAVWDFGVLCPLAAMGLLLTVGQWRRLWIYYALIASMAASVTAFYVMARYRFPLVPLLIPFAAVGLVELWRRGRGGSNEATEQRSDEGEGKKATDRGREGKALNKMHVTEATPLNPPLERGESNLTPTRPPPRRGRGLCWGPPVVVGVLVAGVVNWPVHPEARLDAMAWMNVGVALAESGDVNGATPYFRRAVKGHPQSAEANNNLGMALAVQGDFAGAIPCYETALASEPGLIGVAYNLAVALERVGRLDEARLHFERALALDSSDTDARTALGRLQSGG